MELRKLSEGPGWGGGRAPQPVRGSDLRTEPGGSEVMSRGGSFKAKGTAMPRPCSRIRPDGWRDREEACMAGAE